MDPDKRSVFKSKNPLPPDTNGYCYLEEEHFNQCFENIAKRLISKNGRLIDRFSLMARLGLTALFCVMLSLMIFNNRIKDLLPTIPVG